ncbi:ribonuclease III [Litorilinea aerophila]|uniref:Ribonuclease 3 n=1 Tax=Litorilinea aerophila TaxID=1204385 RepID=A0A540VFX0_9CHLR|nr:ribonuclease III [Litorilinea aerophila]MCC9077174.1 ribonuclease III [Litorilinea aerophila]
MSAADLSEFEERHHLHFNDKQLLQQAFVHRSYLNEAPDDEVLEDNERLEFLGDAILGFIVSEELFRRFPEQREGDLTNLRAALVRRETLARLAERLDLGDYLLLGHGEDESGGRQRSAILCATFEALVGAIYLEHGIDVARHFVLSQMEDELALLQEGDYGKDPKSRLQEWAQEVFGAAPRYKVVDSEGPDHARIFTIQVSILQHPWGVGRGHSKQEASQAAAAMALHRIGVNVPEYTPDPALEAQWPLPPPLPLPGTEDGLNQGKPSGR